MKDYAVQLLSNNKPTEVQVHCLVKTQQQGTEDGEIEAQGVAKIRTKEVRRAGRNKHSCNQDQGEL